jgi:hypothetical protein
MQEPDEASDALASMMLDAAASSSGLVEAGDSNVFASCEIAQSGDDRLSRAGSLVEAGDDCGSRACERPEAGDDRLSRPRAPACRQCARVNRGQNGSKCARMVSPAARLPT